jgi:hypothetical protein
MAVNKIDLKSLASNPSSQPNLKEAYSRAQNQINRGADGFLFAIKRLTSADSPYDMNVNDSILICDTTGGSITINLLPALDWQEKLIFIKKIIAANTVTIEPSGAETIDDAANLAVVTQYACVRLFTENGEVWTA